MKSFVLFAWAAMMAVSCGGGAAGPLELDREATMVDEGMSVRLALKGTPPRNLQWSSGDEAVASVDRDGNVLGISHGDAWIYVQSPETGEKDSCLVSVGYLPQNPILPPSWEMFIADGEPHVFDGRMYIFGSRDNYDGYGPDGKRDWCSDNYHVIWSDDLLHWNDAGEALNLRDIPEEVKGGGIRLWAPDVFKDPKTGKFHMVTCTNNDKVFILDADRPEGPYTNARTVTLNGQELGHIDPGILVDDDGRVYLALPKFIVAELDPDDYSRIIPESVRDLTPMMPTDNDPFEGPSLRKRRDTYYYIYIQNNGRIVDNGWIPTRMAYLTAKAPLGPYTYQGLIVTNHEYPNTGNVHGSFESWEGEWYVQYHRSVPGISLTRVACLDRLEFNPDGTIVEVKMSSSGVRGAFKAGDQIQSGAAVEYSLGRAGGQMVELTRGEYPVIKFTADGQWTGYRYVDFTAVPSGITVSVASGESGGRLEIRVCSPDGPVIASLDVPDTDNEWKEFSVPVEMEACGKESVYLVATCAPFRVKCFKFDS